MSFKEAAVRFLDRPGRRDVALRHSRIVTADVAKVCRAVEGSSKDRLSTRVCYAASCPIPSWPFRSQPRCPDQHLCETPAPCGAAHRLKAAAVRCWLRWVMVRPPSRRRERPHGCAGSRIIYPSGRGHAMVTNWLFNHCDAHLRPGGTCRMGSSSDPRSVVDDKCRVIGVSACA
jgi:hypothetical protein